MALYKTLSVKQPYATLICAGVKDIENRTWKTDYRGRLLIHASGDHWAYPDFCFLPKKWQKEMFGFSEKDDWAKASDTQLAYCGLLRDAYDFYGKDMDTENESPEKWLKEGVKKYGFFMPAQAIIGEVTLVDVFDNLYDANSDFAEAGNFYWKLADPALYDKPIINVMGHLRLWDFEKAA